MATKQILRNTGALIEVTFYVDGTATDADGAVTVGIVASDATTVAATTAATNDPDAVGRYYYSLAPQANLDKLTVTWTGTFGGLSQQVQSFVEIVGGYHFTLADLRAQKNLADTSKFSNDELIEARQWWETLSESYCDMAFVPRYKVRRISGSGGGSLSLPEWNLRSVRRVWVYSDADTYEAFTSTQLADITVIDGIVYSRTGSFSYGQHNIVVGYEHGLDEAPADIRQAGLEACRHRLLDQQQGPAVYSVTDAAGGVVRYAMPGPDRPTGLPSVDVTLNRYRVPALA